VQEMRLTGQVVVLTGASSGIGATICKTLFAEGASVCIGARRLAKLQEVASAVEKEYPDAPGKIVCQQCDVKIRQQVMDLVETAEVKLVEGDGTVDVMINCAGVMYFTKMENAYMDQWDEMLDVNCRGVLHGFGAVIPKMKTQGHGRIVTISSDAGMRHFPTLAVYCASKHFVETLSEITRRELVGTGVTLTTICPGDVGGTSLVMKNTDKEAATEMGITIGAPVGQGFSREQLLDVEDVAQSVIYAITAPKHVAVNTVLIEPRDQE